MVKKAKGILFQAMIIVLVLFLVFVLLVPRKTRETFENKASTIDLYRESETHPAFVQKVDTMVAGLLADENELLHMRSCLQVESSKNLLGVLNDHANSRWVYVTRLGPVVTSNFQDVETKIRDNIEETRNKLSAKTKDPKAVIKGDIFVVVMQAPYHRTANGDLMSVQFNISDYGMLPVNLGASKDVNDQKLLHYEVFVYYSNYDRNLNTRRRPYRVDEDFIQVRSQNDLCFIKCQQKENRVCGCKTGSASSQTYESKCVTSKLGAKTIEQKNEAVPHDFAIIYRINPVNERIRDFVF